MTDLDELARRFTPTPHLQTEATLARSLIAAAPFLALDELTALEDCAAQRRAMRASAEIVREGESGEGLYVLLEGWACRYRTTRDGRRQIVALLTPGDVCNLATAVVDRSGCGVRMLTAGTLGLVRRERVRAAALAHPAIGRAIAWLALADIAALEQWALCLGRRSARERLAHLLCEIAVRVGAVSETGEVAFDMPLTQDHLADVLGLTPVHVNRTMQQMRADQLITSAARRTVIPDVAALRQVCDFDPSYLVQHRSSQPSVSTTRRVL